MYRKRREELEEFYHQHTYNDDESDRYEGDADTSIITSEDLPKGRRGFFGSIKYFFANLLTLGIYGRIKRRQMLKQIRKQREAEQRQKTSGTVEKVTEEELKEATEGQDQQQAPEQTETPKEKTDPDKEKQKEESESQLGE